MPVDFKYSTYPYILISYKTNIGSEDNYFNFMFEQESSFPDRADNRLWKNELGFNRNGIKDICMRKLLPSDWPDTGSYATQIRFLPYWGSNGKAFNPSEGDYFDIEYIAFFTTEAEAIEFNYDMYEGIKPISTSSNVVYDGGKVYIKIPAKTPIQTITLYPQVMFSGDGEGKLTTDYEPYFDGGEVTAPVLRKIGEYADEWDAQTGKGIRRIGVKVLDGTEWWDKYHWLNGKGYYSYRTHINSFNVLEKLQCLCTHYPSHHSHAELYYGEIEAAYVGGVTDASSWLIIGNSFPTVAEFKAFLAEQYANGTPVTVYYVMAEPKPFETPAQPFKASKGFNQIWETDSAPSSLDIKVKYI